jgi:eukaryotic-like serine/threonine-protein kinase
MPSLEPAQEEKRWVGRYLLHGVIAAGGMATVYFGRFQGEGGFSRTVAVKCLHPQFALDPEFRAMFVDEARLCARIRHPNVVSTLDVVGVEGELSIVMEYVQGESLARLLRLGQRLGERIHPSAVATIMNGVLEGLHAAHEATSERGEPLGIVHRDVSPQNIMVGVDGVARVVDFGVAKAVGRLQTTREGQLKGKLSYMAPEQLKSENVDRRTDVYAASVVMWEALTGRRLFESEHEVGIFGKVLEGRIEPPSAYAPDVPAALDPIVMRGLERDPARRFASAQQMAMAIEEVIALAPPRRVGSWVTRLAESALAQRAEKLAEIESVSSVNLISAPRHDPPAPTPPWPSVPPPATSPSAVSSPSALTSGSIPQWSGSAQIRTPGSKTPWLVFGAVAVVVLSVALGGALFALLSKRQPASGDPEAIAMPQAEPAKTADPAEVEPLSLDDLDPSSDEPPAASAVGSAPAPKPRAARPSEPRPGPKPAGPAPKGDCNPPYTVDAQGTKIPKLHCL